jgi:hypothetical protein
MQKKNLALQGKAESNKYVTKCRKGQCWRGGRKHGHKGHGPRRFGRRRHR